MLSLSSLFLVKDVAALNGAMSVQLQQRSAVNEGQFVPRAPTLP